jgi:hypothetical protein
MGHFIALTGVHDSDKGPVETPINIRAEGVKEVIGQTVRGSDNRPLRVTKVIVNYGCSCLLEHMVTEAPDTILSMVEKSLSENAMKMTAALVHLKSKDPADAKG